MSDAPEKECEIAEGAFPRKGTNAEKLRFLLRYAVLAPSSRNSQPWLFRFKDDAVELLADRSRSQPVIDLADRELTIACGAALMYLRIAIRHFGFTGDVEEFADQWEPDLLARVKLGTARKPTLEDKLLFEAIPKRHTNRKLFQNLKAPSWLLSR